MGPFSNNTPPPPIAPNNGSKLPVPDIDGAPQNIVVSTEPNNSLAAKKWFVVTMISAGVMAALGLIIFIIYVIVSNTPGYILNAAMQNLVMSDGEAGKISYEIKQNNKTSIVNGDFLTYTDPTNPSSSTMTLSAGRTDARVSGTVRLFEDGNYFQVAGLGNVGRLMTSLQGDGSIITADRSTRLSSLDSQWHTFTQDDVYDLEDKLPRQLTGMPTSKDVQVLRQLYLKHPFMTSVQQLGDEQIEGINTMHLKVGFDQAKLGEFLHDLKSAQNKSAQIDDDDIRALQNGKALGLDNATIEVWVSRSDRRFQQIRITHPESSSASRTLTITLYSEQVATQRQTVVRPVDVLSATKFVRGVEAILGSPTTATTAQ